MKIAVIIPAAGASRRFAQGQTQATLSKIEQDLAGQPVFLRSLQLFINRPPVGQVLLAVNPDTIDEFKFRWGDKLAFHGIELIPGGKIERWETVRNALQAVHDDTTHVAVHDAARPLTSDKLIERVFEAARTYNAVIPGVPVNATLKKVADVQRDQQQADPLDAILGSEGKVVTNVRRVVQTVDRSNVIEVQTPQVFEVNLLRKAYASITDGKGITDDAGLVEAMGETVYVVEGESTNLKITWPTDMEIALAIAEKRGKSTATELARKRLFGDDDE